MTWCVNDGPVEVRGKEFLVSNVDGDSTLALFLESVHDVSKSESSLTGFSSEFLVLFDHVLFDVTGVQEETSNCGGLSVVNVPDKHDIAVWLASVFPLCSHGNRSLASRPTIIPYIKSATRQMLPFLAKNR